MAFSYLKLYNCLQIIEVRYEYLMLYKCVQMICIRNSYLNLWLFRKYYYCFYKLPQNI